MEIGREESEVERERELNLLVSRNVAGIEEENGIGNYI